MRGTRDTFRAGFEFGEDSDRNGECAPSEGRIQTSTGKLKN